MLSDFGLAVIDGLESTLKLSNKRILLYSMGCFDEAHSPALPMDIDDEMARKTALLVAQKTGTYYKGHLPYCSDKVGEVAKDWCPIYMNPADVMMKIVKDIRYDIKIQRKYLKNDVSHAAIISCHGGNNFLKSHEAELHDKIGIPMLYVPPFEGVKECDERYGEITMAHADIAEHSIAAYLGLLNESKLKMVNELAQQNPEEALKRWPTIAGLGGYRLFGGPRYDVLRNSRNNSLQEAKRFIKQRRLVADVSIGKKLFEANIDLTIRKLSKFAAITS